MKITKFISSIMVILMVSISISGCDSIKYNAVLYNRADKWVSAKFLFDNKIRNAYYSESDYGEWMIPEQPGQEHDDNAPDSKTFIINTEDEFNKIFANCPVPIDFEKEMIILHIYLSDCGESLKLRSVDLSDKVLTVFVEREFVGITQLMQPVAFALILKMDKTEINEAVFEKHYHILNGGGKI